MVPIFFLTNDDELKRLKIKGGKLGDIAPTILSVMKVGAPIEMNGEVLLS
jgi:2,3-bisphosphoglycerate-independent phosphoglycerate mutase